MEKQALITGAASGIGYVIAERFAREGYGLFITSRNEKKAAVAASTLAGDCDVLCHGIGLEQGEEESIREAFKKIEITGKGLDVLILNAANLGLNMDPFTVSREEWENVIKVNLCGGFLCCREAASIMRKKNSGAIVLIGSNVYKRAVRNRSAYIASKGGIVSLTKALALDFGSMGIRVNCLLPGSVYTERWDSFDARTLGLKRARIPLGREARYADIANAAYFLASSEAGNISGAELIVDGGVDSQLFPGV